MSSRDLEAVKEEEEVHIKDLPPIPKTATLANTATLLTSLNTPSSRLTSLSSQVTTSTSQLRSDSRLSNSSRSNKSSPLPPTPSSLLILPKSSIGNSDLLSTSQPSQKRSSSFWLANSSPYRSTPPKSSPPISPHRLSLLELPHAKSGSLITATQRKEAFDPDPISSSVYSSDLDSITSDSTQIFGQITDTGDSIDTVNSKDINNSHSTVKLGKSFRLSQDYTSEMAMNHLEVESTSTTSLPISSLPYFYYTDHNNSNSFDTFDLLNQGTIAQARYPNTQHHRTNTSALTSPTRSNFVNSPTRSNFAPHISADSTTRLPLPKRSQGKSQGIHFPPHLVHFSQQPIVPISAPKDTRQTSQESFFNQVPKRFSQFILDQQNPYIAQRLDDISVVLPSLYSDYGLVKKSKNTESSTLKRTKITRSSNSQSVTQPTSTRLSYADSATNDTVLSRQISNSMGSQATIFSTRAGKYQQTPSGFAKKRRGYSFNFGRARSSKVKVQPVILERRNAVRSKAGGAWYRIQLRIKKMILKLKNLRYHNFRVSSKRFGRSDSMKRSNSLARKKSLMGKKGVTILAPSTNPFLGKERVHKVDTLNDTLKMQAGAENMNHMIPTQDNRNTRLTSYIDDQQQKYMRDMRTKSNQSSIDYSRHHRLDPKYYQDSPGIRGATPPVPPSEESLAPSPPPRFVPSSDFTPLKLSGTKPRIESFSAPRLVLKQTSRLVSLPPISNKSSKLLGFGPQVPPKDNQQLKQKPHSKAAQQHEEKTIPQPKEVPTLPAIDSTELSKIWKDYLGTVIHKRILLRQEISMYQSFMLENTTPHSYTNAEVEAAEEEQSREITPRRVVSESITSSQSGSWKTWSESMSDTLSYDEATTSPSSPERSDPSLAQFNKALNRRSMLGEMLEYELDGELAFSSLSGSNYSNLVSYRSQVVSDLHIAKQYSVVPRRNASDSIASNDDLPIRRSIGYQFNLASLQNK